MDLKSARYAPSLPYELGKGNSAWRLVSSASSGRAAECGGEFGRKGSSDPRNCWWKNPTQNPLVKSYYWASIKVRFKLQAMWPCEIMHIVVCFWVDICVGFTIKWDHMTCVHYLCPPRFQQNIQVEVEQESSNCCCWKKKQLCKAFGIDIVQLRLDRDSEIAVAIDFFMHFSWPFGKHQWNRTNTPSASIGISTTVSLLFPYSISHTKILAKAHEGFGGLQTTHRGICCEDKTHRLASLFAEFWKTLNIAGWFVTKSWSTRYLHAICIN